MLLVLIYKASKLPLPTVSIIKPLSYISSLVFNNLKEKRIKIERDIVSKSALVVVVDNILSTGETFYAVL